MAKPLRDHVQRDLPDHQPMPGSTVPQGVGTRTPLTRTWRFLVEARPFDPVAMSHRAMSTNRSPADSSTIIFTSMLSESSGRTGGWPSASRRAVSSLAMVILFQR